MSVARERPKSGRILVTGGAGYVGSALVPRLLECGYDVRVVDKLVFGRDGLDSVSDRIELIACDIRDIKMNALEGLDAVIHLAGLSNDPTAEFDPDANESINARGTVALAHLCKKMGVERFIFASSCSVYYTERPDASLRDEQYPIAPAAPYSRSKYDAELGLLALADDDFSPVILRKGTVFGSSPRMRYDLVANTFTKDAFTNRRVIVHAGGRTWRPLLHILDAVDAYVAVLKGPRERLHAQIFNVLSGNFQVIKIAHEVRRALEVPKGIHLNMEVQHVGTVRSYRVAGEKFKETLGVEVERSISSAVGQMWDELEMGIDCDHPIHYNIRWLELLVDMQRRIREMGGGPL